MWGFLFILFAVVMVILLFGFFWWGVKKGLILALNSVVGFFALYAVQAFLRPSLVIDLWSVLLTAIFGIFGFFLVLILHIAGFAF